MFFLANSLYYGNSYFLFNDSNLEVWQTPGHTWQDCSLLVHNWNNTGTTLAIVGDLFFNASDSDDVSLWQSGSDDVNTQRIHRRRVACSVDFIVPGHGSMFAVTSDMKESIFKCSFSSTVRLVCCEVYILFCIAYVFMSVF